MAPNKKNENKWTKKEQSVKVTGKVVKQKAKLQKKVGKEVVKLIPQDELKKTPLATGEKDLIKIEKKRAKKLAQKLKKKQKKLELKAASATVPEQNGKAKDDVKKPLKDKKKKLKKTTDELSKPSENLETEKQIKTRERNAAKKAKRKENENRVPTERDPDVDAATVFVGNLPSNTKRMQLVRLFKPYGEPKSIRLRSAAGKVMFKHKQRKATVSINAYVVLDSAEKAQQALALNGIEFKENVLRVTLSEKNSNGEVEADAKKTILVGNLKYSATEDKLREIFSSCGDIEYVRCLQEASKGCKGVAYVCFKAPDAIGLALELNETVLDERPIHVERYSVKKLGAKAARDTAASAAGKTKNKAAKKPTGAQKRIMKKDKTNGNAHSSPVKQKKSEFRGVKVDTIKKKVKKSKTSTAMQQLAKKIAPKPK